MVLNKLKSPKGKLETLLKTSGLRITPQRQAILEELNRTNEHRDVEEIYSSLKKRKIMVSRATLYRTLELLVTQKLIRRLDLGEGKLRFESREGEHHDHIICIECDKIIEFVDERIEKLQEKIVKFHGFTLDRHVHQLFGHCSDNNCPNK